MTPSQSSDAFREFLDGRGFHIDTVALDEFVECIFDYYANVAATGLSGIPESDMLLFQCGTYDWGRGDHFEFDLTRQFIAEGYEEGDGDDAMSQLHCTMRYEPSPELRLLKSQNHWCQSRAELPAFRSLVLSSEVYRHAMRLRPVQREVRWDRV